MAKLLEVNNLHVHFQSNEGLVKAVRGISFDLQPGEVLGLVGESGCGKSVTSLAIMGLLPKPHGYIAEGSVKLDETRELRYLPANEMQLLRGSKMSMIFQEPMTALNPVLTIGEQIGEVLEVHQNLKLRSSENTKRCIEALDMVAIPRAAQVVGEYPHQFSGGMRQRIMIAMALSCNPSLLIADEPTTALDVTIQAQVLDLLRDLKKQLGTAIIFITHDLGVINEMADRVAVMYAGRIVEEAAAKDLFSNPQHPYTQGLMLSRPGRMQKGQKLYCIPGSVPSSSSMPLGCPFGPRCEHVQPSCLLAEPELQERLGSSRHYAACSLANTEVSANV